jgi:chromosome segregation protein
MTPRLKSLELHGYKTFASKILFDFPGNITAIVGPNGSGKSNIADALRWVLGEQAYSILRGRKTEDMIFTGSEQRPRASMASATIVFNNDDGWLPIDFSEVSITRRAYRDGDNEYLINGQRVRLKEINELLSQTGLSERTYTVIGQGLVDAALSLKPEERRRFFEEAAGIGLYRSRRDESINRLEATKRNLERVNDILAEIKPRLTSLEKQARRAQEFDRVKADLRLLLRDWYGYQWNKSQLDFNNANQILRTQEALHLTHSQKLAEIDQKYQKNRSDILSARTNLDQWHKEMTTDLEKKEVSTRELAVLDERNHAIREKRNSLQLELVKNQSQERYLLDMKEDYLKKRADLSSQLQEATAGETETKALFDRKNEERTLTESALQRIREYKLELETKRIQSQTNLDQTRQKQKGLHESLKTQESSLEKIATSSAQAGNEMDILKTTIQEQMKKFQELDIQKIQNEKELETLSSAMKRIQEKQLEFGAQHARLEAQLKVLESAEAQLVGSSEGAKFVMNAFQKGKLSAAIELIQKLLIVPPEYEKAIAAALGESVDAILLKHIGDQEKVLAYLQEQDSSRVTIFVPGEASSRSKKPVLPGEGVIGLASDLVTASDENKRFVSSLLEDILIVDNRHSAKKLRPTLPGEIILVTLIGEVFLGRGLIIAGKETRSSMIGRPREKKDAETKLAEISRSVDENQRELSQTEIQIKKVESLHQDLVQRIDINLKESEGLTSQVQKLDLVLKQNAVEKKWHQDQITELEKQIQQSREQINLFNKEIVDFRTRSLKTDEEKTALENGIQKLNLEDSQQQMMVWNSRVAVLTTALKEIETRLEENQDSYKTNQVGISEIQASLEQLNLTTQQVEKDTTQSKSDENTIKHELELLQEKINPAELQLSELEKLNKTLQQEQDTARNGAANAERYYTQAQIEMNRQKEKVEVLRERIEEDFGLVAFDYSPNMIGPSPLPFEGLVEQLPKLTEIPLELEGHINQQKAQLRRMGPINQEAEREFTELQERDRFLNAQTDDLNKAETNLRQIIAELDDLMKTEFKKTFTAVEREFHQIFTQLFAGGSAKLMMTEAENINDTGVDIQAKLPGRREQGLSLLSGGERSLTAAALIFALLRVSPTPFCVLDEVDAMLDEANVGRFCELLNELSKNTQFLLITHNRNTVQVADVIYGVTMGKDSASQVISLKMDELTEEMVK